MADTIREFLVSLGFKLDEPSWSRFQSTIESATLKARLFGDALEGVAKAVAGAVARVASDFEDLFYASSRLGASVESIRAFGYAVSQMGGTVAGAQSSLRAFGDWVRQTPGWERLLNGRDLGIVTRDAQGREIDRAKVMLSLGERLAQMAKEGPAGQARASAYAGVFGIDQDTLLAIERQGARGRYNEAVGGDKAAGIGGPMAAAAARFKQALRDTFQRISTFATGAEGKLFGFLTGPLEKFNTWLGAHKGQINDALTRIAESAGKTGEKVLAAVEKIDWDKLPTQIDNFAKSLGDLSENFGKFLGDLDRTRKTLEAIIGIYVGAKLGGMFGPVGAVVGGVGGGLVGYGLSTYDHSTDPNGEGGAPTTGEGVLNRAWRGVKRFFGGGDPNTYGSNAGSATPRNTADAMRVAMDQLAKLGVPAANLRAAAAELTGQAMAESQLNPGIVHDGGTGYGIYGARLDRRDKMLAWLAKNGYTKNSLEGQMRYMAIEAMSYPKTRSVLMGATQGNILGNTSAVTEDFESPAVTNDRRAFVSRAWQAGGETSAAAPKSPAIGASGQGVGYNALGISPLGASSGATAAGAKHVSSNITNNITVASSDPDSAASAVGVHLDRTAADAYRNLMGSVA